MMVWQVAGKPYGESTDIRVIPAQLRYETTIASFGSALSTLAGHSGPSV
jgi:hypothetical protein